MTPAEALDSHRRLIAEDGQAVSIRRYAGVGPARVPADKGTQAFVRDYASKELVGAIVQGDQVAIMLVDALVEILPVRKTDFLVVGADEFAIKNIKRRVVGGVLIALEIHSEG